MSDDAMKASITDVFSGILSEKNKEIAKLSETFPTETIEHLKELLDNGDMEMFHFDSLRHFEDLTEAFIARFSDKDEIQFLLLQSQFIEVHFKRIIQQIEGHGCCADKSRTIMRALYQSVASEQPIVFNYEREVTFHLPKTVFNTHDKIYNFFKALHFLFYGNPERYLKQLNEILAPK